MPGQKPELIEAEIVDEVELETDLEFSGPYKKPKLPVGQRKSDFKKFTPHTRALCVQGAMAGVAQSSVAGFAKISPATLKRWLERGQEMSEKRGNDIELDPVDEDFADFYEEYVQARAAPEVVLMQSAMDHGRRDGNVALATLKVMNPSEYNKGTKATVEVEHGGSIEFRPAVDQAKRLSPSELRKALKVVEDQKALPEKT